MHPISRLPAVMVLALLAGAARSATPTADAAADQLYVNGVIFTADAQSRTVEALAVRDGVIVFAGDNAQAAAWAGEATVTEDLGGRFVMPGLVDGHMHPLSAGAALLKCSLHYASLTVAQLQQRVQGCLEASASADPDAWLEVVAWFQENMRPAGARIGRADLDRLHPTRPVIVRSSFGHTVLANTRALALAGITARSPDPLGGKIWRDADGEPTGLLEDSAYEVFQTLIPQPTAAQNVEAAKAALAAMASQGVTSFLDAAAYAESMAAFSAVRDAGQLTARAHFAPAIEPAEASDPARAVARVIAFAQQYDAGEPVAAPNITVRNAKLFLDGVIAAPALTGAMLEPYRRNAGSAQAPRWVEGASRGPAPYFEPAVLADLLQRLGRAGIDPQMHADGDAAVRAALDAVAALRRALPEADIRPAIAHAEIVAPADLPRFRELGVVPVLSFQWGKPAGDTVGLRDYFGPERAATLEPAGLLAAAGARIAFGSDWPVDALDQWFALKVGVTRTAAADAPAEFGGRLGTDPGLSPEAVLRAATVNAAWELRQDTVTGSLEAGKFADFIVLDRNPLAIPAEDIAATVVLRTVVGGSAVYTKPR